MIRSGPLPKATPTTEISFPKDIVTGRPNSLLNEYNAASMAQRITWAINGQDTRDFNQSLVGTPERSQDLLLSKGLPSDVGRLLDIRHQIDGIYGMLTQSDVLILTLGMTLVWKDLKTGHYLNRMPDIRSINKEPKRYIYMSMDLKTIVDLLATTIERTKGTAIRNILLTVSPVPLQGTFFPEDCVISNGSSKATLRCAAHEICQLFPNLVDYFPSYEIVLSNGLSSFKPDRVHVRTEVVKGVMDYMLSNYMK